MQSRQETKNTTISRAKVAAAFGKSNEEFNVFLPVLLATGFPVPGEGGNSFDIASLLEWLVSQQENQVALMQSIKLQMMN